MSRIACFYPVLFLFLAGACAGAGGLVPASSRTAAEIVSCPDGERLSLEEAMDAVADCRVVYLGEDHNNDHHHAFQLDMVRALHRRDPRLVIGMEMFQRPWQPALDRFLAGEIDEAGLLRESEYFDRWKWDWRYYRPILLYAREHGLPVVALNSPKEANQKVSRGGGLTALTPEERKWVAEDVDLTIASHREFVMAIFKRHPMRPGFDLDSFYASQCLWEDTMAESVAKGLAAHPGHRMAVIVGSGHVRYRFGIPIRAQRRGASPYAVFVGMTVEPGAELPLAEALREDLGDFLFFTPPAPETPPTPKLGVNLHMAGAGTGLLVTGVSEGGIAAGAGVEAGDRIVMLDDTPVATLEDLQIALALLDRTSGTLTVVREGETVPLRWKLPAVAP